MSLLVECWCFRLNFSIWFLGSAWVSARPSVLSLSSFDRCLVVLVKIQEAVQVGVATSKPGGLGINSILL